MRGGLLNAIHQLLEPHSAGLLQLTSPPLSEEILLARPRLRGARRSTSRLLALFLQSPRRPLARSRVACLLLCPPRVVRLNILP